jgi:chemotaxis protein methyltransferase CheR
MKPLLDWAMDTLPLMSSPAITAEEFARLCDFFYRRTGIIFTEAKRYYLERRLGDRMAATNADSFATYFARLRMNVGREIEHLINAVTVNETYFNREDHQFLCLTHDLLPQRVRTGRVGEPIRIWSAPCSTGEEAYSIAIWLLENWPEVDAHDVEIIGSDIDTRALLAARDGVYRERALARLTPDVRARYFETAGPDTWRIISELRESIAFSSSNLIDPIETRAQGVFDVIFCRNVLIYFSDETRRIAAENLYESLKPGGFICLGHTESMSRISPLFIVRRFADAIVYQKPEGPHG